MGKKKTKLFGVWDIDPSENNPKITRKETTAVVKDIGNKNRFLNLLPVRERAKTQGGISKAADNKKNMLDLWKELEKY